VRPKVRVKGDVVAQGPASVCAVFHSRATAAAPDVPMSHGMRRIRGSFHLALTVAGTLLVLYAVLHVPELYDRLLVAALGLVLIEAGIWRITQSLFPNERAFRPLRKETDYFITLVRRLNRAALAAQRDSAAGARDLAQVHDDMHHSVDRMLRLAGLTEEDLGFRYRPARTPVPADEKVAAGRIAASL
jgi:hypothetical protein